MILRMEKKLNIEGLPTSKPDYTIYSRKGEIIGCIETKATGKLLPKSVVQGMLQLISLQPRASNALFNIITNAFQFIFVLYKRDSTFQLQLESNISDGSGFCKILRTDEMEHIKEVAITVDAPLKKGQEEVDADEMKSIRYYMLPSQRSTISSQSSSKQSIPLVLGPRIKNMFDDRKATYERTLGYSTI